MFLSVSVRKFLRSVLAVMLAQFFLFSPAFAQSTANLSAMAQLARYQLADAAKRQAFNVAMNLKAPLMSQATRVVQAELLNTAGQVVATTPVAITAPTFAGKVVGGAVAVGAGALTALALTRDGAKHFEAEVHTGEVDLGDGVFGQLRYIDAHGNHEGVPHLYGAAFGVILSYRIVNYNGHNVLHYTLRNHWGQPEHRQFGEMWWYSVRGAYVAIYHNEHPTGEQVGIIPSNPYSSDNLARVAVRVTAVPANMTITNSFSQLNNQARTFFQQNSSNLAALQPLELQVRVPADIVLYVPNSNRLAVQNGSKEIVVVNGQKFVLVQPNANQTAVVQTGVKFEWTGTDTNCVIPEDDDSDLPNPCPECPPEQVNNIPFPQYLIQKLSNKFPFDLFLDLPDESEINDPPSISVFGRTYSLAFLYQLLLNLRPVLYLAWIYREVRTL